MRSRNAADYDMSYNRIQWAGEEYILEELMNEHKAKLTSGRQYSKDEMYWIGYTYRYWHFLTGESSKSISKQVPAKIMRMGYEGFHTEDTALAVEDLKRLAEERKAGMSGK
jgi:hypothetical protein